jgi:hypothetical protein
VFPPTYIRECLRYDPATGQLTWLARPAHHFATQGSANNWNARWPGRVAGRPNTDGYIGIHVTYCGIGKCIDAHRLAFVLMLGRYPTEVDHINRIRNDNRWSNLREVTRSENMLNTCRQLSRSIGVRKQAGRKRFHAYYCVRATAETKRRQVHVGMFDTEAEAVAAVAAALSRLPA